MFVTYGGQTLRAADWSLGGVRLEGFPGPIPAPGAKVDLKLAMPFQGFDVAFAASGEVVRNDAAKGMFALRFTELGTREAEVMRHFIEELVRGAMSDVADTIQRIDLPVTPVSTKPDVNPGAVVPIQRWPVKTIFYTGLYAAIGLFVFSYIAVLGYTNVFRLEVDSAVISAPMVTVQAPNDGHVLWTSYKPGDAVKAGSVVLQVADNVLERDIDLADIDIRNSESKLAAARIMLADALSQLEDLATIQSSRIDQSIARLEALKAAAVTAESNRQRTNGLQAKGFATRAQLETAERDAIAAKSAIESQKLELAALSKLAASSTGHRYFTGSQFVGERARLEAEVKLAEANIALAKRRKQALMEHRLRLAVVAPFDGLVMELPRVDHASINRGDVIAVIEQPRSRTVTAYLTQDEVLHVGIGDEATVYVPAFDTTLIAKVASIDRTSGFANEMQSRFDFRNSRDRSAQVSLQFQGNEAAEGIRTFRSGTPVVVIFRSRSTNEVIRQMRYAFSLLPGLGAENSRPPESRTFTQVPPGGPAPAPASKGTAAIAPPALRPSQTEAVERAAPLLRPSLRETPVRDPEAPLIIRDGRLLPRGV